MKLNEALMQNKKVCVALRDDKREIGCYFIFDERNRLTDTLNTIVGDVLPINSKDYDYIKTIYVSEKSFTELVMDELPNGRA